MEARDSFELEDLVINLDQLRPENVGSLSVADLEWVLADFVLSQGQQLQLEPNSWPESAERENERVFAHTWWPFSIAADFPRVSEEQVLTIALFTTCHILYTVYIDDIIDNPETARPEVKMAIPFVLDRQFRLASTLFEPDSLFWEEIHRSTFTMSKAMLAENRRMLPRPTTLEEYIDIARGRMAFSHLNSIGLAVLNGSASQRQVLHEFWDAYALAPIVYDDITDWWEDYRNQTYSYLHTQVLFSSPFREEVEAGILPDIRELGIALFFSDVAEALYDVAEAELLRAQDIATRNGYQKLTELSEQAHARLLRRRNGLTERKLRLLLEATSQTGG